MGMYFLSRSSYDEPKVAALPNPDPKRFKIKRHMVYGQWHVVEVHYPDCTNYEGRKILVMHATDVQAAVGSGQLDPHFSEKGPSPVARFEPTERGWDLAQLVANDLDALPQPTVKP